jgi:hypothetical protein
MARDWGASEEFQREAKVTERREASAQWVRDRIQNVKSAVTAHDVCRHFGVKLRYAGSSHSEQLSCPFHGPDNRPSAKIHPESARSASALYCFVCQKRWGVIDLWRMFKQYGDDIRFTQVLFEIERAFGITVPDGPAWEREEKGPSEAEVDARNLLDVCERRLRDAKPKFSCEGFMKVSYALDLAWGEFESRASPAEDTKAKARVILDVIGRKIRA